MKELIEHYGEIVLEAAGFSLVALILLAVCKTGLPAELIGGVINGMI